MRSATTTSSAAEGNGSDGDIVYFQGHASPGIYARAFLEGDSREKLENFRRELKPAAGCRRTPSVADARLLGIPDRVDGPRSDHGDLSGALQPLPRRPRPQVSPTQGLGLSRRWRDRRARSARRHHPGVAREARQPDLRRQLQPAAARRAGARQRPDHPGARGAFRGAGWNVIKVLWGSEWDAAREGHEGLLVQRWAKLSMASIRNTPSNPGLTSASTSGAGTACSRW